MSLAHHLSTLPANARKLINYYVQNFRPVIQDRGAGIQQVGHEGFVGGQYEVGGQRQLAFCLSVGVQPHDVFLDVACGSLRLGRHLIPYLDPGNYIGFDREQMLIDIGIAELRDDVGVELVQSKQPFFVTSDRLAFEGLPKRPTVCMAFSLFTHLDPPDIRRCLANLRPQVSPGTPFYVTFGDTPLPLPQIYRSHSHRNFLYSHGQMRRFGEACGWSGAFLTTLHGGQRIFKYVAR